MFINFELDKMVDFGERDKEIIHVVDVGEFKWAGAVYKWRVGIIKGCGDESRGVELPFGPKVAKAVAAAAYCAVVLVYAVLKHDWVARLNC